MCGDPPPEARPEVLEPGGVSAAVRQAWCGLSLHKRLLRCAEKEADHPCSGTVLLAGLTVPVLTCVGLSYLKARSVSVQLFVLLRQRRSSSLTRGVHGAGWLTAPPSRGGDSSRSAGTGPAFQLPVSFAFSSPYLTASFVCVQVCISACVCVHVFL